MSTIVAGLDVRQERVLLRLVEAMDLVDEEHRAAAGRAAPRTGRRDDVLDLADAGGHRAERDELGVGRCRQEPRERRLACARRAPENQRMEQCRDPMRVGAADPGPSRCAWPTNSSSVRGRMRSASGVPAVDGSVSSGKRGVVIVPSHGGGRGALPEKECRGHGHVERIHAGPHRHGDASVGKRQGVVGKAAALVAEQNTKRASRACCVRKRHAAVGHRGHDSEAVLTRHWATMCVERFARDRARGTCCPSRREVPSIRPDRPVCPRVTTPDAPSASAVRMTRADVARILDVDQRDDECARMRGAVTSSAAGVQVRDGDDAARRRAPGWPRA